MATVTEKNLSDAAYRVFMPSEATHEEERFHGKVRCVIVTPERAVLDALAELIVVPLYDGELGVLAGRSPFVGQLGPGELRLKTGSAVARFFVDGGFVQVRNNVVNVLTARAIPQDELTAARVTSATQEADAMPVTDTLSRENKQKAQARAKAMARLLAKAVPQA